MDLTEKIFEQLDSHSFSFARFFKKNIRGILATLTFHMFLIIVFLLIKIQGFKETFDLDVILDYTQQPAEIHPQAPSYQLTPAEQAYMDKLLSQAGNASNRASNISEKLEKEISTENFVDDYLKQLEASRTEEWRKQQEEINKSLEQPDYIPPAFDKNKEVELDDYSGPSNISYEFLEAPVERYKVYLPVPVYKCQGEGSVFVNIVVDQAGKVISAQPGLTKDYADKDCLLEVARNYALNSRFAGNLNAPKFHKARIVYTFIPQ